jgi:hypothetical protein
MVLAMEKALEDIISTFGEVGALIGENTGNYHTSRYG